MPQPSPYDDWADLHDAVFSSIRADAPMYARASAECGGTTLELGVGSGRVALPTAAMGADVAGIDSSRAMLDAARAKLGALDETAGSVELIAADMRDFDLRDANGARRLFPLVTIPFSGFLALLTVEDQMRALSRVRAHLESGGRLIFDIFAPDPNMALERGDAMRHAADAIDPDTGARHILYQQSEYDAHNQIVNVRMAIERLDANGAVERKMYRDYRLRYLHRWEARHLLKLCGFEIEALYGGFDLSEFDESSETMIWVCRKSATRFSG